MKKIALICLIAIAGISVNAQKTAHINLQEIVSIMPEKIAADEKLKTEANAKGEEIKKMQDAIQAKVDAFEKKVSKLTDAEKKTQGPALQKEYQSFQEEAKRLDDNRAAISKELQKKSDETYAPIEKKLREAIEKVSVAKGYDYIIDSSIGVLLVAKGYNLFDDVKKELGIK